MVRSILGVGIIQRRLKRRLSGLIVGEFVKIGEFTQVMPCTVEAARGYEKSDPLTKRPETPGMTR